MIKVLILFTSSEIGGAERSLTRMAMSACRDAPAYLLATLGAEGAWSKWSRSLGAEPIILGHEGRGLWASLPRLVSTCRAERPDILYVMGLRAATMVRLLRPLLPKCAIVHGIRANLDPASPLGRQHKPFEYLLKGLTDFYLTNAAITKKQLSQLAAIADERIDVIYNGIDVPGRAVVPATERPLEIVTIANLAPRKGHIAFLDVVAGLKPEFPSLKVRFIGRDDMNGAVADAISAKGLSETVELMGYVAQPDFYMQSAQLMVLPSIWGEGCPTSVLESLALGTPVAAYAIDGLPELVDHAKDGYLAPPGDADALRGHIADLLANAERRQAFGEAGRRKVSQKFTIAHCAEGHAKAWQYIASSL
jgi:glycosyltransferase involved in cell wall biosynthesis